MMHSPFDTSWCGSTVGRKIIRNDVATRLGLSANSARATPSEPEVGARQRKRATCEQAGALAVREDIELGPGFATKKTLAAPISLPEINWS